MKKAYLRIIKIALWTLASIVLLLLMIGWILSSGILTDKVEKIVGQYIDGDLNFDKVKVSLLSHFPSVSITLTEASLTYPSSRFGELDSLYDGHLGIRLGKDMTGSGKDTLAYFKKLTLSSNVLKILGGNIDVRNLEFESPKFYAKYYNDSTANWKMFHFPKGEKDADRDTTVLDFLKSIDIRRVHLGDRPVVNICNPLDSVFLFLSFDNIDLRGHLDSTVLKSRADLDIDTLFVAYSYKRDTMAYLLDKITFDADTGRVNSIIKSKLYVSGRNVYRKEIPLDLFVEGDLANKGHRIDIVIDSLKLKLANIPLRASGNLAIEDGKCITDLNAAITSCNLSYLKKEYLDLFVPELKQLEAGAVLSLNAHAKGAFGKGKMPKTSASVTLRNGFFALPEKNISTQIYLGAHASMDTTGYLYASVDSMLVNSNAINLDVKGKGKNLLGKDPIFDIDGKLFSNLDSLSMYLPEDFKYVVRGIVNAKVNGEARLSQLQLDKIAKTNLRCKIDIDSAQFESASDSISIKAGHLGLGIGIDKNRFDTAFKQDTRMLALICKIDSARAVIKDMRIKGEDIFFIAQNSAEILRKDFDISKEIVPINGVLKIGKGSFKKGDSLSIRIQDNREFYKISARQDNLTLPLISLGSKTGRIMLRFGTNRIMGKDVFADYTIVKKEKTARRKVRDKVIKQRKEVPEWLKEEDFKKSDIDLGFDKEDRKFLRSWDLNVNLSSNRIAFASPSFPLKTSIKDIKMHLDNEHLSVGEMRLKAGRSTMKASMELSNIKKAITRHEAVIADVNIKSDSLNINELLSALAQGKQKSKSEEALSDEVSFEQIQKASADTLKTENASISNALVVIPANIVGTINLDAKKVKYSNLVIDDISALISVKERTAQIKDFKAVSDVGSISLDAFYSTKSKKDLKCGFEVEFDRITAQEIIQLIPEIGEMMPILVTFKGMLDCQIGITSQMDTTMNLIPGTAMGIIRVKGKDLQIEQNETVREVTKRLMFKDKEIAKIDNLSIEGLIDNGKFTIFPCVIILDRYIIAVSGVQNADASFKYHVSLIKSPLLVHLGLDIYGSDFDHIKYKMVKPLYVNTNVPVYSKIIDSTRVNLKTSIRDIFRRGVQKAIDSNRQSIEKIDVPDTVTVAADSLEYAYSDENEAEADTLAN